MTRDKLKPAGFMMTAFAALVLASATAHAQEGDTTGVFMKDVLGKLGIIEEDAPQIDYRERAPLVLPPASAGLPAPRAGANEGAAAQGNWPVDPDVAARQRAIDAARVPASNNRDKESARVLSVDEIRSGRKAGAGAPMPSSDTCYGDACSARPLNPNQMRALGSRPAPEPPVAYGQEPERSALTQPPAGYRRPADNAPLPEQKRDPVVRTDGSSPYNFINRNRQ